MRFLTKSPRVIGVSLLSLFMAAFVFFFAADRTLSLVVGLLGIILGVLVEIAYKQHVNFRLEVLSNPLVSSVPSQSITRWVRRWNSRWMVYGEGGNLLPYVEDGITIEQIEPEIGLIEGIAYTAYDYGGIYKLTGRMVDGRIAFLTYTTGESGYSALDGIMILRMNKIGEVRGWWLGAGRDNRDLGGRVILEPCEDTSFELQLHPYPPRRVTNGSDNGSKESPKAA